MRRLALWLAVGAVVLGAAVVIALAALPPVVRLIAAREIADVTGRVTSIGDVDLNLFTRHLVVRDIRVSDGEGRPPVAELGRLDARVQLASLLRGRLDIDTLTLEAPVLRIRRDERGALNVADIIERFLSRPAGEAGRFSLRHFVLARGRLLFEDRLVSPAYTWETAALAIVAADVGTELTRGRATIRFALAGAQSTIELAELAVRPFATRFRVTADGFEVSVLRAYLPPNAPVTFTGGRLVTRVEGRYDVRKGLVASGRATVRNVALVRPGAPGPFLAAPSLTVFANEMTWSGGVAGVTRLEISGTPSVLDRRVEPARRLDVTPFRLVLEGVRHPALEPARVTITAGLPDGATFDVRGTAALEPLAGDLTVTLAGANLGLVRSYLPADIPVTVDGGVLAGRVRVVAYRGGVMANGDVTVADLVVARRGQSEPFARDPLVKGTIANLTLRDGIFAAGEITLTGAPSFVDASRGAPKRFDVAQLNAVLRDASWPARGPATVEVDATLAAGGVASLRGTVHPGTRSARARAEFTDVELAPFAPYLPPDAPVAFRGGRVTGRARMSHERAAGVRIASRVTLKELVLVRPSQTEPLLTASNVDLALDDLVVKDGVVSIRQATLGGSPSVTDVSTGTPQRFDLSRLAAQIRDLSWPAQGPAGVSIDVALARGGASFITGAVHPGTLDAEAHASLVDVDLTRFTPYLPSDAPLALGGGRVTGHAHMTRARGTGVRVDAAATLNELVLLRRGQAGPLVEDPSLDVSVRDLLVKDGAVSVRQTRIAGTPRVVESSGRVPQPLEFSSLAILVEDLGWPARTPTRVKATGVVTDGGRSTLEGSLGLSTLDAEARATFENFDLTRLNAYLPPDAPVVAARGRVGGRIDLVHDKATGVTLRGDGAITDLALTRRGEREPFLTDRRLAFAIDDFTMKDEAYTVRRIRATGAPELNDASVSPARRLAIPSLTVTGDDLASRKDHPGRVTIEARLPEAGALTLRGTVGLESRSLDGDIDVRDAALGPFTPFLPVSTDVRGRVDATFTVRGTFADGLAATARGGLRARDVAIGAAPYVSVTNVAAQGVELRWPHGVTVDTLALRQPYAFVERAADGSFPLRAMLSPRHAPAVATGDDGGPASAGTNATAPGVAGAPPGAAAPSAGADRFAFSIGTLTIEEGDIRFLDRTTQPFYSEELTQLALSVRGLANTQGHRADVALQGIVGGHAALDLKGVASSFGEPFFLDVAGELRDFPVARTNPYMQRFLAWIARSGRLTNRVHYRVEGDQLHATNEILVRRLDVEPSSGGSDRLVGLPLGLAVSLLKDRHGDIRLNVPVDGRLSAPHFSFGGAIGTAVRNVISRLVTAPFRAIGHIFHTDEGEPEVKVQPLVFAPGSAALTPEATKHLQRVADFLRESPHARIGLGVVVSRDDVVVLRAQRTTARIQRLQRDRKLADFAEAARALYAGELPGRTPPATTDEIVSALAAASPEPDRATQRLVTHRLAAARQGLIEAAGIAPERVVPLEAPPAVGAPGDGRIEFKLLPA